MAFVSAAVVMRIKPIAVGFICLPRTFINVTFSVNQSAVAAGDAVLPESIISGAIRPYLDATAVTLVGTGVPFSFVEGSIFKVF